jgi:hypothetical protein
MPCKKSNKKKKFTKELTSRKLRLKLSEDKATFKVKYLDFVGLTSV